MDAIALLYQRKARLLMIAAACLMVVDIVRLRLLPQSYQEPFTDGFEVIVCVLCVVAYGFAAARSSLISRALWLMTAVYFVLNVASDLHDFMYDLGARVGVVTSVADILGWCIYLSLALLVFFPTQTKGPLDWGWISLLDFLQVTTAIVLVYLQFVYLPRHLAGQQWKVFGSSELVRNVLIACGLLLRSVFDPSARARAIYRRVGGVFACMTFLRVAFPGYLNPTFAVVRPALFLLLGIFAARWVDFPDKSPEQEKRHAVLRLFLALFAAVTLFLVVVLALRVLPAYRGPMSVVVGTSIVLFGARSTVAEHSRDAAECKLGQANSYNRSLIEASLDPLVTIDAEGRILDINHATEKVTGRSKAELVGTDFADYFTEPEKARRGYQQVFREGLVQDYELAIRHHDGHATPVMYNASLYRDEAGNPGGAFAAAREISERKRAEAALRENEARFRTLVEDAPLASASAGTDGPSTLIRSTSLCTDTNAPRNWWGCRLSYSGRRNPGRMSKSEFSDASSVCRYRLPWRG